MISVNKVCFKITELQLQLKVSRLRLREMRVMKYYVENKALFET